MGKEVLRMDSFPSDYTFLPTLHSTQIADSLRDVQATTYLSAPRLALDLVYFLHFLIILPLREELVALASGRSRLETSSYAIWNVRYRERVLWVREGAWLERRLLSRWDEFCESLNDSMEPSNI